MSIIGQFGKLESIIRELTPYTGTATASGDTTILTPASGKKIRVYFFEANNGGAADITAYFKFGSGGTGKELGKTLIAKNGGGFARSLVNNYFEGAADEVLKINLSSSGTINWTIGIMEV